jgi:hypothetical protein
MANLKNGTRGEFAGNWTLVVQASPDAGTTSAVIVSSSNFLRILASRWLAVFRQSCGCSDIGLLIDEQVIITKYGSFICQ